MEVCAESATAEIRQFLPCGAGEIPPVDFLRNNTQNAVNPRRLNAQTMGNEGYAFTRAIGASNPA